MKPCHGQNKWIDRFTGCVVVTDGSYPDLPGRWEPYYSPYRERPYDGASEWVQAANAAMRYSVTRRYAGAQKGRTRVRLFCLTKLLAGNIR